MNEKIIKFCNEYYNFFINYEEDDSLWIGKGIIIRRDLRQIVEVYLRFGKSKDEVNESICNYFYSKSNQFQGPPDEWNSEILKILYEHVHLFQNITDIGLRIQNYTKEKIDTSIIVDDYFEICKKISQKSVDIVKRIEQLNDYDRINILRSKENVYDNTDDQNNIIDTTARLEIFSYFINPTDKEVEAHESHKERCAQIVKDLKE